MFKSFILFIIFLSCHVAFLKSSTSSTSNSGKNKNNDNNTNSSKEKDDPDPNDIAHRSNNPIALLLASSKKDKRTGKTKGKKIKSRYIREIFTNFEKDLIVNDKSQCYNKHCSVKLVGKEKYICQNCYNYYRNNKELRKKERNRNRNRNRNNHNKSEMLKEFKNDLHDESNNRDCCNIHCSKKLEKDEKEFCTNCHHFYMENEKLKGRDSPTREKRHSYSSVSDLPDPEPKDIKTKLKVQVNSNDGSDNDDSIRIKHINDMIIKFKEDMIQYSYDFKCINLNCGSSLKNIEKEEICQLCYDHYIKTGTLRKVIDQK